MNSTASMQTDPPMHVYLTNGGAIGIRSRRRPNRSYRDMYVVYEWKGDKFCMATFPEIPPDRLCSEEFLYVGKIKNPPLP